MAVNVNDSNKQVGSALWTGVCPMRVVSINPTMEEMKAMGINAQKEPIYKTEDKGITKFRIDIYLKNLEKGIRAKASFWMEDRERASKDGAIQYINAQGQVAFPRKGTSQPDYDWFSKDGLRPAFVGEEFLIPFVKAWANVDLRGNCSFDTIADMVKGNINELLTLFKSLQGNQVKVLLGVKDGKYQDVYTKYFARFMDSNLTGWKNALEAQYGDFKADYQNDLHLKPYEGNGAVITDKPADMGSVPTGNQPAYKF